MNVRVEFTPESQAKFEAAIVLRLRSVKPTVLEAMRDRCYELVMGNFGTAGVDRPFSWPPLSYPYALKVKREIATLVVTGALKAAVQKGGTEGDSTTVSISNSSVPYATIHQTGGKNMPARPYFPINDDGEVLPYSASEINAAAQEALRRALS
jgi:phage gpG-like protein